MTDPVKLSRERWEMLTLGDYGRENYVVASLKFSLPRAVEIDGVIFLPAEYVPAESHVEYHFGNGSSIAVG